MGEAAQHKWGAIGGLAGSLARLGAEKAGAIYEQARREAVNTRLVAGDRQLSEFEIAQLYHPETGAFATVKGADSLKILDSVTANYDELAMKLETALPERERPAFRNLSERRRENIRQSIVGYTAKQMDVYAHEERKASLLRSQQLAVANADNPLRLTEELQKQQAIIATIPGLGPAARAEAMVATLSATHQGVIENYLARGLDQKAQAYYTDFKDDIVGPQQTEIEQKLESATTAGTGLRAAETIWQQRGPKSETDPISLDEMEQAARTQFANDPKSLEATIHFLRERKAGVDAGRKDRQEAVAGALWVAVAKGATLADIRRMPQYVAAPGQLQARVSQEVVQMAEHLADRSYTQSERAYTAARRREAEKEQAGFAMYWNYSDPAILSQMSANQVLGLVPDLGIENVNRLMTKRTALAKSDEAVREAKIDDDLFKTTAQSAGLDAYSPKTDVQKAALGQLRNTVETAIDVEQQRKGKALTRDEKQAVMHSIVDRHVMIDHWYGDERQVAAVVNPKDRAAAYVPIAEIPERTLNEWVNVIRSQFPSAQRLSRADILSQYRDRIQRAHAAAVLGLGTDEEVARLQGRR